MKRLVALLLPALFALPALAQTSEEKAKAKDKKAFPKYETVVKGWKPTEGFLKIYRKEKEESLLAAVPADLLGKPFFLATSVSGGTNYAGWQWQDKLLRFERFGKKLLLVELNTRQRAEKGKPVAEVVRRTYADRLIASLAIKSISEDEEILVDLGKLLTNQSSTFFGMFSVDTSLARFTKVKVFPHNIEVAVQMPLYGDGTFVTLYYSISRLPELKDYTPRKADDRIGYFLTAIRDYTAGDPREGRMVRLINRWKLEKADPELALSPPKEPIVFYVEKTVPIAYRRAVAQGILGWNKAFEQTGIVGAIEVRQQRETQFADIDPEDVRYNFFRWITSESAFAMGPSRVDPRNGRILDADIIFDDSMLRGYMSDYDTLLRDGPEKLLTPAMRRVLAQNPSRHPMARFRELAGRDAEVERAQRFLTRLGEGRLGKRLVSGLLKDEAFKVETAEDLAQLPERLRDAKQCMVGEFLPHKVGIMRLAFSNLGREGGATGPVSDAAFDDYLAQIVRETVMHEVGHTLGLRHNFQASSMFDLDALNSEERPEVLTASVMDYHPVNLYPVAKGKKQGFFLTQGVGPYDMLAIEYGYKLCKEDDEALGAVARKLAEKNIPYATDEDLSSPDPSIAQWDLGDDPVKYAAARLKLVKNLWKGLEARTVADNESYSHLRRALDITLFEIQSSSNFVARQVGGLNFSRDHRGDPGARDPIRVVSAKRQRASLRWLCDNILSADAFPVPKSIQSKLAASRWSHWGSRDGSASLDYSLLDRVLQIQTWVLFFLTSDDVLARIWENEQRAKPGEEVLTLPELFDTLEGALFSELKGNLGVPTTLNPAVSSRRQNIQDAYVNQMISITLARKVAPPVAVKLAWSRLKTLEGHFANVLANARLDPYTRAHLEVLEAQSKAARSARYVHVASGVSGCALGAQDSPAPWALFALAALACGGVLHRRRACLALAKG